MRTALFAHYESMAGLHGRSWSCGEHSATQFDQAWMATKRDQGRARELIADDIFVKKLSFLTRLQAIDFSGRKATAGLVYTLLPQSNQGCRMATKIATKPVSRADLIKQRDLIDKAIAEGYQAEAQTAVDAFVTGLEKSGIALSDALALLGVGKKVRAKRGTAKPKATGDKPTPGATYRHPKTGEEWVAPANLRRAKKWLQDLVVSSGKKYEDFVAKK